jgi:hypothetical protein
MKSDGYSNTLPSFAKHEHLFDDKWVDSTIFRNLVSARPDASFKISSPGRPTLSVTVNGAPQFWPVRIATLALDKKAYKPGELASAELIIELEDTASDLVPGIYRPTAAIEQSGQSQPVEVRELTNSDDLAVKQLRFAVSAQVRSDEGIGTFVFHIEDALDSSQAFYVSPAIH